MLRGIDGHPQLIRWTAIRAQRDAELLSARLKPIPDLRVELGLKHIREPTEEGIRRDKALKLQASIPIPVWDQNLGGITEAGEARAKVEAERAISKAALTLTLAKAYDTLTGAAREIEILRGSAIPNARTALDGIESGYAPGALYPARGPGCPKQLRAGGSARAGSVVELPYLGCHHRGPHRHAARLEPREKQVIRFFRTVAGVILAVLLTAGLALYLHPPSGGKAPTADPHGHGKHEGHGAEGVVELTDAKVAAAGIELEKAAPGVVHDSLFLNGILQPNQETLVQVTPRFPGVAREIHKRVGDRVEKGALLAKIESNQSLTVYELKAPLAGTIIDRQISLGEHVGEQKPAFTIADLSSVWVDFSVYRRDLNRVRVGDTVKIDAEDGGSAIETKISYISPVGNSDTQSGLARAVVGNENLRLRPGLFVTGRLLMAEKPVGIAIKSSALQTLENRTVVFVRVGEKFEARDVEIGERDPEHVEITFGLLEGDVYAAKNSFVVKAELAKGTASHDH